MFCDEVVIGAYKGSREYDDLDGANEFLDCYHGLAYHVTDGYRMVLETEHYYISIGAAGVSLHEKTCTIEQFEMPGEWLDPYIHEDLADENEPPWVDFESTLFVGERLIEVQKGQNNYILTFDDFTLLLVPHELNDDSFPSLWGSSHWSYHHIYGCERLITKKCPCGGHGELLLDFVSDYVVRCQDCKKSTWAQMNAIEAIEEWNGGYLNCELNQILIE